MVTGSIRHRKGYTQKNIDGKGDTAYDDGDIHMFRQIDLKAKI